MGFSKDYADVKDWEYKDSGYRTGDMIKYQGNIFKAKFWAQTVPGAIKPPTDDPWEFYDELYDITSSNEQTKVSKVIAYLPAWKSSTTFQYSNPEIYRSLTHLIISFLMFDILANGQFDQGSINEVNFALSNALLPARSKNVKVMVGLGGANDCGFFKIATIIGKNSADPLLAYSTQKISDFVFYRDLDGIDLNLECWRENINGTVKEIAGRSEALGPHPAGIGLSLFASKLRELMPGKFISATLPGTPWHGANFDPEFHKYLDWVSLMTYLFTGSWNNSPVGPHTALYKIKDQSIYEAEQQESWPGGNMNNNPIFSTEESVWYWTNSLYTHWQGSGKNIPRNKIVLGIPAFGYDFSYGSFSDALIGTTDAGYKVITYKNLVANFPDASIAQNACIKVLGSTLRPVFISASGLYKYKHNIYFETPQTAVNKLKFCQDLGCQGVMVWELSGDVMGTESIIDKVFDYSGNNRTINNKFYQHPVSDIDVDLSNTNDPYVKIIRIFTEPLALLANYLGYAWAGGDVIGKGFIITKKGNSYIAKAQYKQEMQGFKPYDRLQIIFDDFSNIIENATFENFQTLPDELMDLEIITNDNMLGFESKKFESNFERTVQTKIEAVELSSSNPSFGFGINFSGNINIPFYVLDKFILSLSFSSSTENDFSQKFEVFTQDSKVLQLNYNNYVSPGEKENIQIKIFGNKASANCRIYSLLRFSVTFSGFMRSDIDGGNFHIDNRASRENKTVIYKFGHSDKSFYSALTEQLQNPAISEWMWKEMLETHPEAQKTIDYLTNIDSFKSMKHIIFNIVKGSNIGLQMLSKLPK